MTAKKKKSQTQKKRFVVNSLTLEELKEISFTAAALRASRQKWGGTLMKYEGQAPDQMRLRVASDMPC